MSQSKIYVGNLSYDTKEEDLNEYFAQYGAITEAKLITDRETSRSKGFAFITFETAESAQKALKADGTDLQSRQIKVNIAKEDTSRRGGSGGGQRKW